MTTVATVLILDYNTHLSERRMLSHLESGKVMAPKSDLQIIVLGKSGQAPQNPAKSPENILEEDYEIMRSAVRLASLLSFFIGAIIVYYTIGYSVQQRKKEFALLSSLGTTFGQTTLIILVEVLVLGIVGSGLGLLGSIQLYKILWHFGVTTTGRSHLITGYIPKGEFITVFFTGILTAILGAVQPVMHLRKFNVGAALQPRFVSDEKQQASVLASNILSLVVPLFLITYILLRPFLKQLIPSLYFYVAELSFIVSIFLVVVFFIPKVIAVIVRAFGRVFLRIFPLEAKLTYSRFIHFSHLISWPVSNLMLVFAFLLTLHIVTKSLKVEILGWGKKAAAGIVFVPQTRKDSSAFSIDKLKALDFKYTYVRLARGTPGPNRIIPIEKAELSKYEARAPELADLIAQFDSESIIMSITMARQLGVQKNDFIRLKSQRGLKDLRIIEITDKLAFFPASANYRERKSFALIEHSNSFLMKPGETLTGTQLIIWKRTEPLTYQFSHDECKWLYRQLGRSVNPGDIAIYDQVHEINKDFIIFDIILFLSTMLAALGVTNTMLIQVQARRREIALLQVLGMTNGQILMTILVEGFFIGILGGILANLLGVPLGWVSIEALRALSVFNVSFSLSTFHLGGIFIGSIIIALLAGLYPAFLGFKLKSSEFLQYE